MKSITLMPLALALGFVMNLTGCASQPPASKTTASASPVVPAASSSVAATPAATAKLDVGITAEMPSTDIVIDGKTITLMRNQNADNTVNANFAKTSRKCPPFCVQPYELAPGVKTIGELEMIDYLKQLATHPNLMVVDSRTPDWVERGTIPGAVNIPWDRLNIGKSDPITVQDILTKQLGAVERDGFWDFSAAKTLVLFCNGQWCGQSPTNIKGLLKIGYPASKLMWYRGGMQEWENLGLTTVKPAK
ncbi:MAG: rhodanese-like domain-containing protein [Thiobacillus sp.]